MTTIALSPRATVLMTNCGPEAAVGDVVVVSATVVVVVAGSDVGVVVEGAGVVVVPACGAVVVVSPTVPPHAATRRTRAVAIDWARIHGA
jgi:hypothetical protein